MVIYATERVLATLKANSIFNALNPEFVERRPLVLGRTFEPVTPAGEKAGLAVEAFPVPGKVALYLENPDAGPNFGTREGDTVGVKVTSLEGGSHFFYIPGCAEMTPDLADRLRNAPLALFDGTLDQCQQHSMVAFAWSPLAGGMLITGEAENPADQPRLTRVIAVLDRLAAQNHTDRTNIALAFLLAHPASVVPIIGTQTLARITSSARALDVRLTRRDWYDILEASLGEVMP